MAGNFAMAALKKKVKAQADEIAELKPDAELGRMVRALPNAYHLAFTFGKWSVGPVTDIPGERPIFADTPDEALRAMCAKQESSDRPEALP